MATIADAAIVATRRPTGTFLVPGASGAIATGAVASGAGVPGDGDSAVGGSEVNSGTGGEGSRGRTRFTSPDLSAGGREWSPVCQVGDEITWVGASALRSVGPDALVSRSSSCCAVEHFPPPGVADFGPIRSPEGWSCQA